MGIYQKFGVEPFIDCAGSSRFGGILLEEYISDAMLAASREVVRLDELQAAASRVIQKHTGAEAGIVTSGASAGLTLATAAVIAGLDVASLNRLPDTSGMRNEVLMAAGHIGSYDRAIRLAGARIVPVDTPNQLYNPNYNYMPEPWEYEAHISDRTAAIGYISYRGEYDRPSLEGIVAVAKKHGVPVILDAATAVPPLSSLRRFAELGVDLTVISGGKGLRGPKASGLLFGRRDLVASAALQSMEMGSLGFEGWDVPDDLVPKGKLRGLPQQGLGRGMMPTKEAIIGLLVALDSYSPERVEELNSRERQFLEVIAAEISGVSGIAIDWIQYNPEARAQLRIRIQPQLGKSVDDITRVLRSESPRILVRGDRTAYTTPDLPRDVIIVNGFNLDESNTPIVAKRIAAALS